MKKILLISGPTGVGKTDLSFLIARQVQGEIISADSMQIYTGMDIGTAKATEPERRAIPHHMLDIIDPHESYSANLYVRDARRAIEDLHSRGKLPIVVGGTGLYIDGLCFERRYADVPPNPLLRASYKKQMKEEGIGGLFDRLKRVDPLAGERLTENDVPRIMRALEVYDQTGRPFSEFQNQGYRVYSGYKPYLAVLTDDRKMLYERINARVPQMFDQGWVDEVKVLHEKGLNRYHQSAKAIGYREIFAMLEGELTQEEAIVQIQKASRNYAKRQLTWFRRNPLTHWYNISEYTSHDDLAKQIIQDAKLEDKNETSIPKMV